MFFKRGIQKLSKNLLLAIKEIHNVGRFSTRQFRNPLTRTLSEFINILFKDIHSAISVICRRFIIIRPNPSKHLYMNEFNDLF
jgi:hypothetical protein